MAVVAMQIFAFSQAATLSKLFVANIAMSNPGILLENQVNVAIYHTETLATKAKFVSKMVMVKMSLSVTNPTSSSMMMITATTTTRNLSTTLLTRI